MTGLFASAPINRLLLVECWGSAGESRFGAVEARGYGGDASAQVVELVSCEVECENVVLSRGDGLLTLLLLLLLLQGVLKAKSFR